MRTVWPLILLAAAWNPAQAVEDQSPVQRGAVQQNPAQDVALPLGEVIPNQYIVSLKSEDPILESLQSYVQSQADRLAATYGATILFQYSATFPGVALKIQPEQFEALAKDAAIDEIEEDRVVRISAVQNNATFGLDRIDARTGLDRTYNFTSTGAGVNVFVIDTGIRRTHQEFTGRVGSGFTAINDGRGTEDCNGHGTHVSGTVGGTVFGVAKDVTINPVRVLDCNGSGANSGVIAGIDFVARTADRPAVANMSLGGGASSRVDSAVNAAIQRGIVFAVAAGNENQNACNVSPARAPNAITVGATTSADRRASFSNFGRCLDIFAPGQGIQSASIASNTATATLSGTSMASPHVAGVAALLLEEDPEATPQEIRNQMVANATPNVLRNVGTGSPNRLLFSNPAEEDEE